MSMTDPIADLLARIRNGIRARHNEVLVPRSSLKLGIVEILKSEGFLDGVSVTDGDKPAIKLALRYEGRAQSAITGLRRVSRPGQRAYVPASDVRRVRNGLGIAVLSTSQGLMTDREARKRGIGGELLCEVW